MEVNKHIVFYSKEEPELVQYLNKNGIPYEKGEGRDDLSLLDIYESNPYWEHIKRYVKECDLHCLSETIFSKKELESAQWLRVRSTWHFDYPQPEKDNQYTSVTYQYGCKKCGCGLEQKDLFRIKKAPKWGKRHFLMLNWVADELFVDEIAKSLLEKEFPFLSFCGVKDKKGKEIFQGLFQMIIPMLQMESVVERQHYIRDTLICFSCGRKKYHPNGEGMLQLRSEIFENASDIVKTAEWFGWGCGADHYIIVSQKMYRFLVANRLERNLEFTPIELV